MNTFTISFAPSDTFSPDLTVKVHEAKTHLSKLLEQAHAGAETILASTTPADYDADICAWADAQARLLRAGRFAELDIAHLADEVEDVGKSEQRELASRMAVLLAHLTKWRYQPKRRGHSWETAIRTQRSRIARELRRTPSLAASLRDPDWWADAWDEALDQATRETRIRDLPRVCPWGAEQVLAEDWLPED